MTCEKCGGAARSRGYGDDKEYIRKYTCQTCGHIFYTSESILYVLEGKKRYAECYKYNTLKRNAQ